jgi:hypothetical protein
MSDQNINKISEDADDNSTAEMISQYSSINFTDNNSQNVRRGKYSQNAIVGALGTNVRKGNRRDEPPDDYICKRCGQVCNNNIFYFICL